MCKPEIDIDWLVEEEIERRKLQRGRKQLARTFIDLAAPEQTEVPW